MGPSYSNLSSSAVKVSCPLVQNMNDRVRSGSLLAPSYPREYLPLLGLWQILQYLLVLTHSHHFMPGASLHSSPCFACSVHILADTFSLARKKICGAYNCSGLLCSPSRKFLGHCLSPKGLPGCRGGTKEATYSPGFLGQGCQEPV